MKLKMRPPRAELTLPDGSTVEVERIGKGRFTTAWRNCRNVYLQTHEDDSGKEILANLAFDPRNKHIPACERMDSQDGNAPYRWFKMPLYHPLTAKSGQAWQDYKILHQMQEDAWGAVCCKFGRNSGNDAYEMRNTFSEMVQGSPLLSDEIKEAVQQLVDECANYGDYSVEIVKRNCMVDDDGTLILIDPVFDLEAMRRDHKQF